MLGLAARHREVVAERPRHVLLEVDAGHVGWGRDRARAGREAGHQPRSVALLGEPARVELGRRLGADDDLARGREILELEHARGRRPGDEQLAVRLGGEKEMAWTRMDADRHPQLDRADRALRLPDLLDRPLHVGGRAGRPLGVALVDEQQQQRVAAELEHVAAVPLGDGDQVVEDGRDALDELLGAGLPVHGEPLGERGEAGDVDRDERAVDHPRARRVGLLAPPANEPGEIGCEH